MSNNVLECAESRKKYFHVAYELLKEIPCCVRNQQVDLLYFLCHNYLMEYSNLNELLKQFDTDVIAVNNGVEAALYSYCRSNAAFSKIFDQHREEIENHD